MPSHGLPLAPKTLRADGRALWGALTRAFEWEPHELHLVTMVCTHRDLWAAAVRGRSTRHFAEARAEAVVVARLLRELKVNQENAARPPDLARGARS